MSVLMAVDLGVFLPQLLTTEPSLLFGCAAMALFYPWAFSGGGDETLVVVFWFNVIFLLICLLSFFLSLSAKATTVKDYEAS